MIKSVINKVREHISAFAFSAAVVFIGLQTLSPSLFDIPLGLAAVGCMKLGTKVKT